MSPPGPPPRPEPRPPANRSLGARGEDLAAAFLEARGCRIVARNLRTVHGEIDLLVRRGADYAAVEVKTSRHHPGPELLVRPPQLDRLARALQGLAAVLRPRPRSLCIDAVAVRIPDQGVPEVMHFPALRRVLPDPP